MSASYTYEMLKQMKGQAVKDVWHAMIGKPAGLKNTTGLKNTEEIIQAILNRQANPEVDPPKQVVARQVEPQEMPRKKQPTVKSVPAIE